MRYLLLLSASLAMPAERHWQDGAKLDLERMQGTWILTNAERAHPIVPDKMVGNSTTIIGNEYRRFTGEVPAVIFRRFKLLPDTYPRAVDLYVDESGEQFVYKGIVELKGDTFRFCFSLTGQERPTEFRIGPGSTADSITTYKLVHRAK
jgi:uncharacterized protein (TIGR03067 family)